MVHSRAAQAGMITAGALLALGLAGCQISGSASEVGARQQSASGPATSDGGNGGGGGTSSGSGPETVPAALASSGGRCTGSDLRLTLTPGDDGEGMWQQGLVFTNISGHPCTVQGFPGVSYVAGDNGAQVGAPAARKGSGGKTIRLAHGQTALSWVGFVNVVNYDPAECQPIATRGLRVYSPGETRSKFVALERTGCVNDKVQQLAVKALQRGNGR
ncbi:MAG TPA: DUF4232 domain-containing protein [Actinomadura sp.]|jgi:hypothetical protein|nr:DUF4232 domain-containing protein [Actinomadura sp.]